MIYQIGDIKTDWSNFKRPTQELFESWKQDFLSLSSVNNYNVWLTGGFLEDWNTFDIDIILTNETIFGEFYYSELKELLIKGYELGLKHNILIDIQHANIEPSFFNKGEVEKIYYGKEIIKGERIIWSAEDKDCVYEDLYMLKKTYPSPKQKTRNYKVKPIKLN